MKNEKNLMLRHGMYYFRATVNGVYVCQSLRTDDLAEAIRRRDERLAMLGGGQMSDKTLLKSVERQLAGIEAEEKAKKEDPMQGALLSEAFKIWQRDPTRRVCKAAQAMVWKTLHQNLSWCR